MTQSNVRERRAMQWYDLLDKNNADILRKLIMRTLRRFCQVLDMMEVDLGVVSSHIRPVYPVGSSPGLVNHILRVRAFVVAEGHPSREDSAHCSGMDFACDVSWASVECIFSKHNPGVIEAEGHPPQSRWQ